jgi:hypothetical protein
MKMFVSNLFECEMDYEESIKSASHHSLIFLRACLSWQVSFVIVQDIRILISISTLEEVTSQHSPSMPTSACQSSAPVSMDPSRKQQKW